MERIQSSHGQLWLRYHMGNGDLGRVRLAVDTGREQPRAKGAGSPLSQLESPGNCPEVTQSVRDLGGVSLETGAEDCAGSILLPSHLS